MFINFLGAVPDNVSRSISMNGVDSKRSYVPTVLISIFLFCCVFLILGSAVGAIWFREDDLGTILNGLVSSWESFVKVFSTDVRDFICPVNYRRSAPNIISGFLRPLQHFLFSVEHFFFGDNAYPYFLVHVGIHGFNVVLLYIISLWFLPLFASMSVALFYAFYPDVSWLTWIATAQNTLCTFFLLASIICWKHFLITNKDFLTGTLVSISRMMVLWVGSGVLFFFSLLARENVVAMPLWFFVVAFIFLSDASRSTRFQLKNAFFASFPCIVAGIVYWALRLWAFGIGSLSRTLGNILLRFPCIASLINLGAPKTSTAEGAAIVGAPSVAGVAMVSSVSLGEQLWAYCQRIGTFFVSWFGSVVMTDFSFSGGTLCAFLLFLFFVTFFVCSYQKNRGGLVVLVLGIVLMSWPALVAYPCPRYLNTIYPFVSLLAVGACFLAFQQKKKWLRLMAACSVVLMIFTALRGIVLNKQNLHEAAQARADYKKRFDAFFEEHHFEPGTRFVVINSPFVSDIQSIFQSYLHDCSVSVAHEPFSTIAEGGNFCCGPQYQTKGVQSKLVPIDGGFRFVSDDHEHCAWWIHFSDHPLAWSEKDQAYAWTKIRYGEEVWYPCSIGKFKIHKMIDDRRLVDVSFVFDKRWIDEKTVVVAWETVAGRYVVMDIKHLFR